MVDRPFVPRIIIMPLQYACDAKCVMCNIWERQEKQRWRAAEIAEVFGDPALRQSVEVVNVTGGEPTLRSDFQEIMEAVTANLEALQAISLQTNAMNPRRLGDRLGPFVDHLAGLAAGGRPIHLDVNISLDGPGEVHDLVRGVPGSWDAVLESLALVRRLLKPLPRSKVLFNCTVVSQNVHHLRGVQQCADDLGVDITFTVPQLTDVYMANEQTPGRFALDDAERAEVVGFLRERLARATGRSAMSRRYCNMLIGLLTTGERNIGCPLSDGGLFLEPGGRTLPCWRASALETGNILEDGPAAVLERRADPAYREKLREHCRTCSINCYVDWTRRMFARTASGGRLS